MRTLYFENDGTTRYFTVGREGDIVEGTDNAYVSRKHIQIVCEPDAVYVTDISRNGSHLNGTKLEKNVPTKLEDGAIIDMCQTMLRVTLKGW